MVLKIGKDAYHKSVEITHVHYKKLDLIVTTRILKEEI